MGGRTIRAGVVGAAGYTGIELMRLLSGHPQVTLDVVTSREHAGRPVAGVFQNLRGRLDIAFSAPGDAALDRCDVVFFATPNGTAMTMAGDLLAAGVRVIDLSADFRLRDPALWRSWYGIEHASPELLADAVYGLPEVNRAAVRDARLVANPGCYPTAVQLGFLPLVERGLVDCADLIADAKSGVSGAGRKAGVDLLYSEINDSFKAYGVDGHRHLPEIRQGLEAVRGEPVGLTFVPHLVPMTRGIHATLYGELLADTPLGEIHAAFRERYDGEPFVDVMEPGALPETRGVRGGNLCRIALFRPQGGRRIVVLSVIDNLVKGAAGQAVQNLNLMFGFGETAGLGGTALIP